MSHRITSRQKPVRQRLRMALLWVSVLLFPITLYYFSPVLIIQGASEGIATGSFLVFALMLLSALSLGRLWCGWACPAGALQELSASINNRPVPRRRLDWVKWAIWFPWISLVGFLAIRAGGFSSIEPLYQIDGGLTLLQGDPPWFVAYYVIVSLFLGLAVVIGRRAGCHAICWMAPFMILGRSARNAFRWPALRLSATEDHCIDCGLCTRMCPMSLDVETMVHSPTMEKSCCILCGSCVDSCPTQAIRYSFSKGS